MQKDLSVRICAIEDAFRIHNTWATQTISIVDPKGEFANINWGSNHHVALFDDIEEQDEDPELILPTRELVQPIFQFSQTFTEKDRILIHCHGGVCRSTAVAIGVFVQHGWRIDDAIDVVWDIRPAMWPNMKVIEVVDGILNLGSQLTSLMDQWEITHAKNILANK